ncbi:MAG: hypothetical protein RLY71_1018 [Pseudomonadota bacterium]|jgi:hypothetical protein
MTPRVFVDLRMLPSGGDARVPGIDPRAAGLVFGAVHRHMRAHPGRFALALPEGRGFMAVLRVFADTRDELDALAEALHAVPTVRDYAVIGYPQRVPEDFDGAWLQYRRYRIPTRRADREDGAPCRARRIEFAESQRLPYLLVHSASTGQSFGLRVCVLAGTPNAQPCAPDSYGLARSSAPFSLPVLPA